MDDRKMVYPYTLTARIARFPFKFYYDNSPYFKFYMWALVAVFPVFWKLQQAALSEASYVRLEQFRKKEKEEVTKHKEHLL